MSLSRQLSGALAWAGLVIVIAVPTVELVRSRLVAGATDSRATATDIAPAGAKAATVAVMKPAATEVVRPAATTKANPDMIAATPGPEATAEPAATKSAPAATVEAAATQAAANPPLVTKPEAVPADPVGSYLATNGALPSYITVPPAAQKLAATLATAAPPADELANPSQPPEAATASSPAVPESPPTARTAMVSDSPPATPEPAPVPMPASARPRTPPAATVTEADLKDWTSGTLEDYLRQHNLLSGAPDQNAGN